MKYVQSFSIRPILAGRYELPWETVVSGLTICNSLSMISLAWNGSCPVLHTDEESKFFLSHLPYMDVVCDLGKVDDCDGTMWGRYRIETLLNEPLGTVHVDGDVVFRKDLGLKQCEELSTGRDFLTLSRNFIVEDASGSNHVTLFIDDVTPMRHLMFQKPLCLENECSYDVGVLQFKNHELLEKYRDVYDEGIGLYRDSVLPKYRMFCPKFTPDNVLTEKVLWEISHPYNNECLVDVWPKDGKNKTLEMRKMGIRHYTKMSKFRKENMEILLDELKRLDKECYNNTLKQIDNNIEAIRKLKLNS